MKSKEAVDLVREFENNKDCTRIFIDIKIRANHGFNWLDRELTKGQIEQLRSLGYKVRKRCSDLRTYEIEW